MTDSEFILQEAENLKMYRTETKARMKRVAERLEKLYRKLEVWHGYNCECWRSEPCETAKLLKERE